MLAGNTAHGHRDTAHDPGQDVPRDVTDVLLWRMAARVIAAHQPQPERPTRCASLLCAGQHYPCPPVRAARRAQQVSRHVPATPEASAPHQPAVAGRPAEHPPRHRFTDWYAATRAMIQPLRTRERPPVQRSGRTPSAALTMPGPARIRGVSTA
ncbi:hypothetical protein I0C86_30880 [Plantactinospora sp. S1510]|uniref:Uncharacterized protein n=1 Tax=Plantactinospora alkalitolerans TaxID=2789879 RepID=A0ABS0H4E6_9ACTN|nr:hypothetical protein [Plantactinospora alkalitolerans]MBF9133335.1 hypothetical protein [Plantactinospora alkalitolerans]